jgi:hypothetical protein
VCFGSNAPDHWPGGRITGTIGEVRRERVVEAP